MALLILRIMSLANYYYLSPPPHPPSSWPMANSHTHLLTSQTTFFPPWMEPLLAFITDNTFKCHRRHPPTSWTSVLPPPMPSRRRQCRDGRDGWRCGGWQRCDARCAQSVRDKIAVGRNWCNRCFMPSKKHKRAFTLLVCVTLCSTYRCISSTCTRTLCFLLRS